MRVLGVLAAWGVLAVLATLCFAVGGSIGYRRGVQDAVRQLRERRSGKTGCRPVPLSHHYHRRPIARLGHRTTASPRAGARRPAFASHGFGPRRVAGIQWSPAAIGAAVAVCVLVVPGVAIGATTAQPGERLWLVKRGLERARLVLASGADGEVEVHVDLAARRLGELNQVLSTGQPDPHVVSTVIQGLRDHTTAANERMAQVDPADRAELVGRVDDLVDRQVAVLDLLMGVDCAGSTDQQCVALADAGEASAKLQQTTTAIALAEDLPVDAADGTAVGPTDMAVSSLPATPTTGATTAAADEASEAASDAPTRAGEAVPSQSPSASASPSADGGDATADSTPSTQATPPGTSTPTTTGPSAPDTSGDTSATPPKPEVGDVVEQLTGGDLPQ